MYRIGILLLSILVCAGPAWAKVDLVTLPQRDTVQITIYNSADMTLVRDNRTLTLKQGANKLQFSWANTLIDPTSLEMLTKAHADTIHVQDLTYPPRVRNLGVWNIDSETGGEAPFEISYLTSGLSWRAFYMGTLTGDEKTMRLQGYVVVTNHSGEDYENAEVRLIVGQVHLLDSIAELARRQYPYGAPWPLEQEPTPMPAPAPMAEMDEEFARSAKFALGGAMQMAPKEIKKEGLSEYFLYTIEGKDTIPNEWSKRLPSFEAGEVPVVNLYKYEEEQFGRLVNRFISFKNDKDHKLGDTPIPGGVIRLFRTIDPEGRLTYEGVTTFKYIPVDEDVELSLGGSDNVTVDPILMDLKHENFLFGSDGNIVGYDEVQTFKVEAKNTRPVPVKLEIKRNFGSQHWEIVNKDFTGEFEKVDLDTVRYKLELEPRSEKTFTYVLTTHQGRRAE